ncbi:MAG TPA: Zn-ribbon domain-containing OB-fold protein [Mycobacteriales bacterium]|nr:Zn-ribbon domain-containing OB-fold protein [Mycobacteriales bacterium]
MTTRPAPRPTDDSAVYWDAVARHELVAQRCNACGKLRHPPRPMCPQCHSLEWHEQRLAGTGTLYSYAVLHHPRSPLFEYPVLAALVDLDEGVRVMTNLVAVEAAGIRIGMRLTVGFEATSDGGTVPVFRPALHRDAPA